MQSPLSIRLPSLPLAPIRLAAAACIALSAGCAAPPKDEDPGDAVVVPGEAARAWEQQVIDWIQPNWRVPPLTSTGIDGFSCKARIGQASNGAVRRVDVIDTCGHRLIDDSLVAAIWKSSPLPLPEDRDEFREALVLTFEHAASTTGPSRTAEEVQKAFDARKDALLRANSARSSTNGGRVVVSFTVAPSGDVVECRIVSSDFADPPFNAAIAAEVWRLRFEPRDVAEFRYPEYPIQFGPRNAAPVADPAAPATAPVLSGGAVIPSVPVTAAPVASAEEAPPLVVEDAPVALASSGAGPVTSPAPPAEPPAATTAIAIAPAADLDPDAPRSLDEIQRAFDAQRAQFQRIHQARASSARGRVVFAFTVTPAGRVEGARVVGSDFSDTAFHEELLGVVSRLQLQRASPQAANVSSFPLIFGAAAATP